MEAMNYTPPEANPPAGPSVIEPLNLMKAAGKDQELAASAAAARRRLQEEAELARAQAIAELIPSASPKGKAAVDRPEPN